MVVGSRTNISSRSIITAGGCLACKSTHNWRCRDPVQVYMLINLICLTEMIHRDAYYCPVLVLFLICFITWRIMALWYYLDSIISLLSIVALSNSIIYINSTSFKKNSVHRKEIIFKNDVHPENIPYQNETP